MKVEFATIRAHREAAGSGDSAIGLLRSSIPLCVAAGLVFVNVTSACRETQTDLGVVAAVLVTGINAGVQT
jgi:hypothetical protein